MMTNDSLPDAIRRALGLGPAASLVNLPELEQSWTVTKAVRIPTQAVCPGKRLVQALRGHSGPCYAPRRAPSRPGCRRYRCSRSLRSHPTGVEQHRCRVRVAKAPSETSAAVVQVSKASRRRCGRSPCREVSTHQVRRCRQYANSSPASSSANQGASAGGATGRREAQTKDTQ